jgi:hypothetical protein
MICHECQVPSSIIRAQWHVASHTTAPTTFTCQLPASHRRRNRPLVSQISQSHMRPSRGLETLPRHSRRLMRGAVSKVLPSWPNRHHHDTHRPEPKAQARRELARAFPIQVGSNLKARGARPARARRARHGAAPPMDATSSRATCPVRSVSQSLPRRQNTNVAYTSPQTRFVACGQAHTEDPRLPVGALPARPPLSLTMGYGQAIPTGTQQPQLSAATAVSNLGDCPPGQVPALTPLAEPEATRATRKIPRMRTALASLLRCTCGRGLASY